jgi:hypothetical protein
MQQRLQNLQYQYHIYNSGTTLMGKSFHCLTHLLIHLRNRTGARGRLLLYMSDSPIQIGKVEAVQCPGDVVESSNVSWYVFQSFESNCNLPTMSSMQEKRHTTTTR